MSNQKINDAISALRSGERLTGRKILTEVLRDNPRNEIAWLWMTACVDSFDQKAYCLNKVLEINPENLQAKEALQKLGPQEKSAGSNLPMPTDEEIQSSAVFAMGEPVVRNLEASLADSSSPPKNRDFFSLSCPSCGAKLEITPDLDRFVCSYCGNEHIVRRQGGVISLEPVMHEIRQVKTSIDETAQEVRYVRSGVDVAAAELAIARLRTEIQGLEVNLEKNQQAIITVISLFITGGIILVAAFAAEITDFWCTAIPCGMTVLGLLGILGGFMGRSQIKQSIAQKQAEIQKHMKTLGG